MSTPPEPPTEHVPAAAAPPPSRRTWRSRIGRRGLVIGGAVVAALVVAAVVAALLIPDGRGRDRFGPGGFDRAGTIGELEGRPGPMGGHGPRGDRRGEGLGRFADTPVVAGSVVSVSDDTLVLTVDGGARRSLRTDDDTRVRGEGNSGLGDLQAGERVVVAVEGTGDAAVARTVLTPQARVTGTVTALDGDRATVTGIDGLVVAVDVSGLSQKPVLGDVVVLSGVAADGTTIRADGIRILPRAS